MNDPVRVVQYAVEREVALELPVDFLVGAAPAHEEHSVCLVTSLLVTMAEYPR